VGGGGLVITLEETPPHPAQINSVTKKKDARTRFIGPFETYTLKCLLLRLDAPALSYVTPKASHRPIFRPIPAMRLLRKSL
jgi:hypothetical protein